MNYVSTGLTLAKKNLKWPMILFGFLAVLSLLIGNKMGAYGFYQKLGNLFKASAGRSVFILIFALGFIAVSFLSDINEMLFGAPAFLCALLVMIISGYFYKELAWSISKSVLHGGIKLLHVARFWMLFLSIVNAAVINVKKFVIKDEA